MIASLVFAVSVVAALLAVALLRERRLRLALQTLVGKIIQLWRNPHANDPTGQSVDADSGTDDGDGDRV